MNRKLYSNYRIILILLFTLFMSFTSIEPKKNSFPVLKGDYLGYKKPGLKAELFAKDIISTKVDEHGICVFSKSGDEVYWSKQNKLKGFYGIMYMKRENDIWQKPVLIPYTNKNVNANPVLSYDSNKIFYITNADTKDSRFSPGYNISYIEKKGDRFAKPRMLESPVNTKFHDGGPFLSKEDTLYFNSNRDGGYGDFDIYMSKSVNGIYEKVENMGSIINSKYYEAYPFLAEDGNFIIFESKRPGGFGKSDLFISFKKKNKWQKPKNMGEKINSKEGRETFPRISPDGKYLFFSSNRSGDFDAYWIDAKIIEQLKNKN